MHFHGCRYAGEAEAFAHQAQRVLGVTRAGHRVVTPRAARHVQRGVDAVVPSGKQQGAALVQRRVNRALQRGAVIGLAVAHAPKVLGAEPAPRLLQRRPVRVVVARGAAGGVGSAGSTVERGGRQVVRELWIRRSDGRNNARRHEEKKKQRSARRGVHCQVARRSAGWWLAVTASGGGTSTGRGAAARAWQARSPRVSRRRFQGQKCLET